MKSDTETITALFDVLRFKMDSFDRDNLVDKIEVMLSDLYGIGDKFNDELDSEALDYLGDAKIYLELFRSCVKDMVCEDDEDKENVYDEEMR